REIEPVSTADLMRFLFRWQHVEAGTQLHGRPGLLEIIGQLQGVELAARAWETHVLPARVARYDPADLEHLCLAGAVVWGRLRAGAPDDDVAPARRGPAPTRALPLALVLREDLGWLLAPTRPGGTGVMGAGAWPRGGGRCSGARRRRRRATPGRCASRASSSVATAW